MKILYLTKYSRNAASSRLRSFQYFPFLKNAGFEVEVSSLFSEKYLEQLYNGQSTFKVAVKGYAKRLFKLFTIGRYNTVIIEKELFPYLPAFAEKILGIFGIRYIADYDDAVFHNYDQSGNFVIKKLLGNKIDKVMKYSTVVVAGNNYLAERAQNAGAQNIQIIPTVIDLERYSMKEKLNFSPFIIGWIGTKSTFEKHLLPCKDWIKKIQKTNPEIYFNIVGITEDMDLGDNVKYIKWTEETEVSEIQKMDVGIMPLHDSLWEQGKCSYKLIQYMACGKPVVASPVGMNKIVVINDVNGYTANSEKDWIHAIETLVEDQSKRKALGHAGRIMVEKQYTLQGNSEKWIRIFNDLR